MNEPLNRLEAELAMFRPLPPSDALRQRIAAELAAPNNALPRHVEPRPAQSPRFLGAAALAIGMVVAMVAVTFYPAGKGRPSAPQSTPDVPRPLVSAAFDDATPSIGTYRRALLASPETLDAVLDRHAGLGAEAPSHFVQTRGFGRFDFKLKTNSGEL